MNNTFDSLPQEKRDRVINAALALFAANGYKKTSVADVANAAGISKAMVFTYFGTKQGLYEFLCDYALECGWEEFRKQAHKLLDDDYFERLRLTVDLKIALIKRHNAILQFLTAMYYEKDESVLPKIEKIIAQSSVLSAEHMMKGVDTSRFKPDVNLKRITQMIKWLSVGIADDWHDKNNETLDALLAEFYAMLDMMKKHLYKEEFL